MIRDVPNHANSGTEVFVELARHFFGGVSPREHLDAKVGNDQRDLPPSPLAFGIARPRNERRVGNSDQTRKDPN